MLDSQLLLCARKMIEELQIRRLEIVDSEKFKARIKNLVPRVIRLVEALPFLSQLLI